MNPERMVIDEARRTFTHLSLYGYPTDAVVVNRVFPDEVEGTYFGPWRDRQAAQLEEVEAGFAPVPILTARFFDREVLGEEMHSLLGKELFGDREPADVLHEGMARELSSDEGGTVIRIAAPFVEKDEISLQQAGEELAITIGEVRRTIMLPSGLADSNPSRAAFEEGILEISYDDVRSTAARPPTD